MTEEIFAEQRHLRAFVRYHQGKLKSLPEETKEWVRHFISADEEKKKECLPIIIEIKSVYPGWEMEYGEQSVERPVWLTPADLLAMH